MTVMGVLAAYIPWGSPGQLAFLASCAWFASPTLAAGIMILMAHQGCIKKAGTEVKQLLCCGKAMLLISGPPGPGFGHAQITNHTSSCRCFAQYWPLSHAGRCATVRLCSSCRGCSSLQNTQPWYLLSWWLPLASCRTACSPDGAVPASLAATRLYVCCAEEHNSEGVPLPATMAGIRECDGHSGAAYEG